MNTNPEFKPSRSTLPTLLIGIILSLSGCERPSHGPEIIEATDWLPRSKFQKYLTDKSKKDDSGKNLWDKGYSVGRIQSRWNNGYQEYKIEIVENPKDTAFWWMWYFDMDEDSFQKKIIDLGSQGYQLISYSQNTTPSGKLIFGAVWNKRADQ